MIASKNIEIMRNHT